MTTTVRPATPDDADLLAALAAITFPLACPPGADPAAVAEHIRTQLSPARFAAWASSAEHALLVAEGPAPRRAPGGSDSATEAVEVTEVTEAGDATATRREDAPASGPLTGYALLVRGVPDDADIVAVVGDEPTVELSKIYVHPAAQGTGVAGDLMRAALSAAPALVADKAVWLGTNGENARAQAFYRKHGFEVAGTRTYVVGGEAHDDVVMVRALG